MSQGYNRSTAAILCGTMVLAAVLPTLVARSAAAGQRGGGKGVAGASQDQESSPPNNSDIAKAKADREQNIKDATRLAQLAAEVKQELENGSEFTLSVASLRKADELEKLSKKLHTRLKEENAAALKPPLSWTDASKGRD